MEEDLISKKELLELEGISYGQLYRWKRKNLIPEEWFVRKSTFTGQETFFPRREILARIERIKRMKDGLSLDELADMFSPNPSDVHMLIEEVSRRNIVTDSALQLFVEHHKDAEEMSFTDILAVYVADFALQTGNISLEEAKVIIHVMEEHIDKFQGKHCELLFIRKLGVGNCLLVQSPTELYFESGSKVAVRLHISTCVEQLKMRLS
jgi:DNA-binding transcriptional MerR regulator